MNYKRLGVLIIGGILLGVGFFALQRGCIIIQAPFFAASPGQGPERTVVEQAREITLFYGLVDGCEASLKKHVLLPRDPAAVAMAIATAWLALLFDEKIIAEKIMVQEAVITPRGDELQLSFTRPFLPANASTKQRWQLVCSLLKTLKIAGLSVERCLFLINHKLWQDGYLDLTVAWPLGGFAR